MNKTVVYTAIIGKKDFLVNPTVVEPNVDSLCFTDAPATLRNKFNVWEYVKVAPEKDRVRQAGN